MSEELRKQIDWEARDLSQRWPLQKDIQLVYEIYLKGATKYAEQLERKDKLIEELTIALEYYGNQLTFFSGDAPWTSFESLLERAKKK